MLASGNRINNDTAARGRFLLTGGRSLEWNSLSMSG